MYNGRIIFNETACIGYDPSHNLVIINNYNGGVLLPDINFSINYTVLLAFHVTILYELIIF